MEIAASTDLPPGVRWESLMSARLSAGCLNARAALFGHAPGYDEWLDRVHATLVRFPSEETLFDVSGNDLRLPDGMRGGTNLMQQLLRLTFGRSGSAGSCAGLATAVAATF
jgi:hypothetical protein